MKCKKLFALALAMVMCVPMSFNALAAQNSTTQASPATSIEALLGSDFEETFSEQVESRIPAPPLTSIHVYLVNSEQAGQEYIAPYQYATNLDHGGSWIQLITLDVGYSGWREATFDGNKMDLTDVVPVDTDGDTILDGYLRLWTLDVNFDNGKFIYHATPEYSGRQYEAWINVI